MLENVWGYRSFDAYKLIRATLDELGYWSNEQHLNSADFGVPQTRKRLILRACRDGFPPALPTKERWRGWYEAIEDLIPGLPESRFADWQLARLPAELQTILCDSSNAGREMTRLTSEKPCFSLVSSMAKGIPRALLFGDQTNGDSGALMVRGAESPSHTVRAGGDWGYAPRAFMASPTNGNGITLNEAHEPAHTMTAGEAHKVSRAFILDGRNTRTTDDNPFTLRDGEQPCFTLTNWDGRHPAFIADKPAAQRRLDLGRDPEWLKMGRVVKMTPRALMRFMSGPDSYKLPEKAALACVGIGNGVACRMAEKLIGGILEAM